MLNKIIERKRDRIQQSFDSDSMELDTTQDYESLETMEQELTECESVAKKPLNESFLYKTFHKKEYQESVTKRQEASIKAKKLKASIENKRAEIEYKEERLANLESKKATELAKLENTGYVIRSSVESSPELTSNSEFMQDCLDVDLRFITMDETNSSELYIKFLQDYKAKHLSPNALKQLGFSEYDIENALSDIDKIITEISTPAPVDEGKYKIPHKFLFEAIKLKALDSIKEDVTQLGSIIYSYQESDGKMDEAQGKKLEELYSNSENYLYLHNINYRGYNISPEELSQTAQSICQSGLNLTTSGNEIGKIKYTTLNTHEDKSSGFLGFTQYWSFDDGIVALQIPKEKIDSREPVIGTDISDELSPENPGTILPEYVVGYVANGQFVENPTPKNERKQFKIVVPEKAASDELGD